MPRKGTKMLTLAQRSLFDPPAQRHSATSVAAAQAIAPTAGTMRQLVLDWLRAHGPATDEQIIAGTGLAPSTARPRRIELVQSGLVVDSGTKIKTKSGRAAVAWRVR